MARRVGLEPRYQQDRHIPHLMNRAAAAMFAAFSGQFPLSMTVPMWRLLAILYEKGEQRGVDLSRLTFIDPSTISRTVSALKRQGLMSRTRSKMNSREVTIKLTARGRSVVEQFIPLALQHEAIMTKGLSERDISVLRRYLRQIHVNMETLVGTAQKRPSRGKSPVR